MPRRSLFEKDKFLFSFLLTVKILDGSKEIDATEWRFLISAAKPQAVEEENPAPEGNAGGWIDGRMWSEVCAISGADNFQGFAADFKNHLKAWRDYDCVEPHLQSLPDKWDASQQFPEVVCAAVFARRQGDGRRDGLRHREDGPAVVSRLCVPSLDLSSPRGSRQAPDRSRLERQMKESENRK